MPSKVLSSSDILGFASSNLHPIPVTFLADDFTFHVDNPGTVQSEIMQYIMFQN